MTYRVAVLGATGLVGRTMLKILEQRKFPVDKANFLPLASDRSAGQVLDFRNEKVTVQEAKPEAFQGVDIVLSSAGGAVSKKLLPEAAKRGAVSIDNTSAYRMDPEVPLVVPECNADAIAGYGAKGIIANPNCSTIQLVVALKPLHERFGLKTVRVATYQSVSGAGANAVRELLDETRFLLDGGEGELAHTEFPRQIAFNALPEIDVFQAGGETKEEWKMRVETPKILGIDVKVHATCVRIPVIGGHSEAVWIETEEPIDPEEAREILAGAPGLSVEDDPAAREYPTAAEKEGTDDVFVGRIRRDPTCDHGLAFWCVADNLRKGAALNAVQIAEELIKLPAWQEERRTRVPAAVTP